MPVLLLRGGNASRVNISKNTVQGVKRRGISIGGGTVATISGNVVHDVSSDGIYAGIEVFNTFDIVNVTGNTVTNPSTRTATGIKLASTAAQFNVSSNTVNGFSIAIDTPAHDGNKKIRANNSA